MISCADRRPRAGRTGTLIPVLLLALACLAVPLAGRAQSLLPGPLGNRAPAEASAPVSIASQRERVAEQLAEALRERDGLAATATTSSNREALVERLIQLLEERLKRLDDLAAVERAPLPPLDANPLVRAIGSTPPYPAPAVDALRDEFDGLRARLHNLESGIKVRETEKQEMQERLRRSAEALRLAEDRLAQSRDDATTARATRERDRIDAERRVAEAEFANLAIDQDRLKLEARQLETRVAELQRRLETIIPQQRLAPGDLDELRQRTQARQQRLTAEIERVTARHQRNLNERRKFVGNDGDRRLPLLDQVLKADTAELEALNGLQRLSKLSLDAWEWRAAVIADPDSDAARQALVALSGLRDGLENRKRLLQEQREAARAAIRDQERRLANLVDAGAQAQERQILAALQQHAGVLDRVDQAVLGLERQLARWLGDLAGKTDGSLGARSVRLGARIGAALKSLWNFELFAVADVSEIDGRRIEVSYGITVGKSIGALVLFVAGYWTFSALSRRLQEQLIRRLGIDRQLATVIRRWVMITLGLLLLVFVLNLARIPLTVFAFMGGALAIGIGFGTQTIIKNFISGIIILFERKIRVGDIVALGGMTGHVTAVDLRATTVRGFDGVEALVPNSNFLENQVVNWTYSNPQIRRELRIGIAYGSDTRQVEALLRALAAEQPQVLAEPAPEVFFEDFADSALLLVLVYWVELGPQVVARRVDSELRHAINARFAAAGIVIPFPQRDLHLEAGQALPVVLVEPPARAQ